MPPPPYFVTLTLTIRLVEWHIHPTAHTIVLSAGFDHLVIVWDVGAGKALKEISCHTNTIYRYAGIAVGVS